VLAATTAAGGVGTITAAGLTVTANALSRTYGAANPALTYVVGGSGLYNGDTLGGALATTATVTSNVGPYSITQGTLANSNYTIAYTPANLTVTAATLTAALTGTVSKVYNGTNAAALLPGNYTLSATQNGDNITLNNPTSGTYDSSQVGINKTVTVTGLGISGAKAADYLLAATTIAGSVGSITTVPLVMPGLTGTVTKVYNGSAAAALLPTNYTLSGVFGSDQVILNDPATGTYDTIHAGNGKTITVTGLAISGAQAGDYTLSTTTVSGPIGIITAATVTAGLTGVTKVYDKTLAASLAPANYTLSGVVGADAVKLNDPAAGTYDTIHVGTGKTVTVTGLTLLNNTDGDYVLAATTAADPAGSITAATVTAGLTGTVSKAYDRTLTATLASGNYTFTGAIGGDVVTLNDPALGTYDSIHVGGKTVTVTGLAISGADAGDYVLAATTAAGSIGTITAVTLTAGLTNTVAKKYDGSTSATLAPINYTLAGVVSGDAVSINTTAGTYDNSAVGTNKTVTVTGLTLSGANASDYVLAETTKSGPVGVISALEVAIPGLIGTVSKVYDGTLVATLNPANYALSGVIGSDQVILSGPATGTYDTIHVGNGKTITATGFSISGAQAANYLLSNSIASGTIGTITTATVTAGLTGTVTKVYDATTTATLATGNYTLAGVLGSDVVTLNYPTAGAYDTFHVGGGKTVTVAGLTISGANASDYMVASTTTSGLVGIITPATVTASLTGTVSKTYDSTTTATLAPSNYALTGILGADVVNLNNPAVGSYDTSQVATGKLVTVNGLTIYGANASDYSLAATTAAGTVGTIVAATVTAGLTGTVSKVYDGTFAATVSSANYTLTGVVGTDVGTGMVTLNDPGSGTYDTIHVGISKTVNVTGLTLGGVNAADYVLAAANASGSVGTITAATVTAGLTGTVSKTYDRTPTATLVPANYTLTGVLGTDVVTLNDPTAGTYDTIHVGTGKIVTVTGMSISGGNASDYVLAASVAGPVGTITPVTVAAVLTGVSKTYDGTLAATLAGASYTLAGVVNGDTLTLTNSVAGTYDNINVGSGKTVTFTGLTLSGANAADYLLPLTTADGTVGVITAAGLTITANPLSRIYGAANPTLTYVVGGSGLYNSDTLGGALTTTATVPSGVGTYAITQGTLLAPSSNYTIAYTPANLTVTPATLTAGLTGTVSKIYDGTPVANVVAANYTLSTTQNGDVITLNDPTAGTYDNIHVGTGKTVTVTGLILSGTNAADYVLAATTAVASVGTIIPATVTAGLTGTVIKTYDGTTIAMLAPANYTFTGALGADVVILNNPTAGTYDSSQAGTGKTVTVAGLALSGANASDYVLASAVTAAPVGVITAAALTVPGLTGTVTKVYDGTLVATLAPSNYSLTGVIGADQVLLNDPTAGTYDVVHVGTGKTVTVTGLAITGAQAADYTLSTTTLSAPIGIITPASLTANLIGPVSKVYDTTNIATLTGGNYALAGIQNGDAITLNNPIAGTYDTLHAGTGKTVTVTGLVISGSNMTDYTLASTTAAGRIGTIIPATVTAGLTGTMNKVYDATLTAALGAANYTFAGTLGTDVVTLADPTTGAFDTKDVGTGKTVSVGGLTLAGANAGDYMLAATRIAAPIGAITPAPLTVTAVGATKIFDTTVGSSAIPAVSGLQGGDTVVASQTYDTAQVGTAKTLTPAAHVNDGDGGADYTVTLVGSTGGVIIANPSAGVYVPTVGNVPQTGVTSAAGTIVTSPIPALVPLGSAAPATQLVAVESTITGMAVQSAPGTMNVPRTAFLPPMTPSMLRVGQVVTGAYSDGSANTMRVIEANARSATFTVPDSDLQLFITLPLANESGIFAQVTVYVADGQARVSLDPARGTLSAADTQQPATRPLEETMTSPGGRKLEFSLSLGTDLTIVTRNFGADAALISGADATLFKIALGRAIIDAYTKLHAGKIPAVRMLVTTDLPTPPPVPAATRLK
jgi:hypothetical protein